ncbi:MAG: ATP synthase F1 subunit delta [Planctomycetota bacterium]|nr:ATP synthase F1 subunit delta [Planctomycetota bacterium]
MHTDALAEVYASSLYELAEEAGGLEKIVELGEELHQLRALADAQPGFGEFLASPIIEKHKRGDVLGRIFRDRITDLMLRFLLVLNNKGRLGHLDPIGEAYEEMVQAAHGRIDVDVYTAVEVDEKALRRIGRRIGEVLEKEPVLHAHTDASMIGGLTLRVGDQLMDGSVAARLRRFRQNLMTTGMAAVADRVQQIIDEGGES